MTSDLKQRIWQHREGVIDGFSKRHGCKMLVWTEYHMDLRNARQREVQMKGWKRSWKIELIERDNPQWCDLWAEINN